jgi:peptidoglycan-N-acetylglucosamine deacetylase
MLNRRAVLRGALVGVLAAAVPVRAASAKGIPPAGPLPAPDGVLTRLPGDGNLLALTVDDGTSADDVAALTAFCRDSGTRLTFFVNGVNRSWSVNAPLLRPLVDSGQIQLGNHTWSHPDLTRLGSAAVADQIRRNGDFLQTTYGVDGTPFFRPPYGRHNPDIDRVAAELGYRTIAMWSATVGDSRPIDESGLIANAKTAFTPQQIVLAHANLPPVAHCLAAWHDIIASRDLQTVTLNDVFG